VEKSLLHSKDPVSGRELVLAPPPFMTPYLREQNQELSFPPRFGQQNEAIYGGVLGRSNDDLAALKGKGVI